MAENRKGRGQGLYYWTRGQLLVLAVGITITSTVVFLLGILIGQGIEERKLLKKEEPLIKIPVQPLSQGSATPGAPGKEEMTFYDTLAKAPAGAAATRVEATKEIKPAEKAAKSASKETKPPVQEQKAAAVEKVKTVEKVQEKAVAEKSAPAAEAKKVSPLQKTPGAEGSKAKAGEGEKAWAVQVNAYPLERDAKSLAKKLKDKGYDAYVLPTSIKGRTWYRVRVGRLGTQEEAKALQEKLKAKENFTKSITTSR